MPELLPPQDRLWSSFAAAMAEFRAEGRGGPDDDSVIGGYLHDPAGWSSPVAFEAFVAAIRAEALESTPRPAGWVPATELWWVLGDEYLGRVAIRHRLTPRLLEIGGHIGYDVRPSARRRGYATEMCRRALAIAKGMGIDRALLTCRMDNAASRRVIEKSGGILEDERQGMLRFWIPTG